MRAISNSTSNDIMNHIVCVPVNENIASFIGKRGSENGLVFYNRKVDNDVIVAIMPANKDDKTYYGMAEAMLVANQIVISTENVDKMLGETIVAASLLDKHIILLNENDVSNMIKGLLTNFAVCGKDELLSKITARKEEHSGELRIDIDKAFPVKGIGTVILGIVTSGTVKVHDNLYHSSGKQVNIKSIQSQDVDVQEAGYGTRVGLAVKGIEYDEIDKGDLLLAKPSQKISSAKTEIKVSAFSNEKIIPEGRYMFVSNFTYVYCRIDSVEGAVTKLSFEKPISVLKGDHFLLIREASPRIFASGKIKDY